MSDYRLSEARGNVYRFLSKVYLEEPNKEFIAKIADRKFLSHLSEIFDGSGSDLLKSFAEAYKGDDEAFEELHQEYMSLFVVPKKDTYLKPYESVYREKRMVGGKEVRLVMGESALAVQKMYEEAGAKISQDYKDLPDHIGLELEFMRFLCEKEAEAWKKENRDVALKYLALQQRFLDGHLTKWIDKLCEEMIKLPKLDFYKGVAKVTKEFIVQDYEEIKALIEEKAGDIK